MEDVRRKHRPAIMIYTELKLTSRQKAGNYLQRLFHKSYTIEYSFGPAAARPPGDKSRQREGTAGVAICVSKKHATPQTLDCLTPPSLQGYVAHIRLTSPTSRPLEVVGVYLPGDDKAKQKLIYEYITAADGRCKTEGTTLLVGGDFNANLFPEDRSSGQTRNADQRYRQFVSATHLCPLTGWEANRQHTYWQKRASPSASSRIDNLLKSPQTEPRRRLTPTEDEKRRLTSELATSADMDRLTQTLGNAATQWRQASEQALATTLATLECFSTWHGAPLKAKLPIRTLNKRLTFYDRDC
ncbi:hypothetical protein N2152v2_010283 [Parachlorella kessleri]